MPTVSKVKAEFLRISMETFGVMETLSNDLLTARIVRGKGGHGWFIELHNEVTCLMVQRKYLGKDTPTDELLLEVLRGWIALHNVRVGNHVS